MAAQMFSVSEPLPPELPCPRCGERWLVEQTNVSSRVVLGRVAPLPLTSEGVWRFDEAAPRGEGDARSICLALSRAGLLLEGEVERREWNDFAHEATLKVYRWRVTGTLRSGVAQLQVHGGSPFGDAGWERFAIRPVARYDALDAPRLELFVGEDAACLERNAPFRTWRRER